MGLFPPHVSISLRLDLNGTLGFCTLRGPCLLRIGTVEGRACFTIRPHGQKAYGFISYLHIVDLDGGSMSLPCESTPVGTAASAATTAATTILTSIFAVDITDPPGSQPAPCRILNTRLKCGEIHMDETNEVKKRQACASGKYGID